MLRDVPGVERVALGFDVMTPEERQALTTKLRGGLQERSKGLSLDASTRVLAVCSGKGGVGKSTLTANLAVALAQAGKQVGILDADVYGHSIPHVLGIRQKPVLVDKMIVPPVKHDLKLMSIGFFLDDNQPVMWRGPMLHRALEQFLSDVHWGAARRARRRHAAGNGRRRDLARTAAAARRDDRRDDAAAGRAGGCVARRGDGAEDRHAARRRGREHERRRLRLRRRRALAAELDVPLLGRVPLDPLLRECGDAGEPLMIDRARVAERRRAPSHRRPAARARPRHDRQAADPRLALKQVGRRAVFERPVLRVRVLR